MNKIFQKPIAMLLLGLMFGGLAVLGIFYTRIFSTSTNDNSDSPIEAEARLNDSKYKFIKPLLSSGYDNEDDTLKWFPVERRLKGIVEDEVNQHPEVHVGMHFLNLTNSGWFGINSSENFIPASLLKLPMLISYYKLHEKDPSLFDQKITYNGNNLDKLQTMGSGSIEPGNTYTVNELLEEMIVNSDNNALELLYKYKQNSLKSIFADMQIGLPDNDTDIAQKDFVNARDIARFLLVLYNASYLSKEDSEAALETLSHTSFKDGIVAGVPNNVIVSHKFGERELLENGVSKVDELHDCGIIYHPKNPYILCILTKGHDLNAQKMVIQDISKTIYEGISSFSMAQP